MTGQFPQRRETDEQAAERAAKFAEQDARRKKLSWKLDVSQILRWRPRISASGRISR